MNNSEIIADFLKLLLVRNQDEFEDVLREIGRHFERHNVIMTFDDEFVYFRHRYYDHVATVRRADAYRIIPQTWNNIMLLRDLGSLPEKTRQLKEHTHDPYS